MPPILGDGLLEGAEWQKRRDFQRMLEPGLYHGKVGQGVSVEMSVKHGPVTLLSVVERAGRVALLVAEGQSEPGPIMDIGNTNSRYRFSIGARRFVESWNASGPAHHCAVGIGHIADKIEKLGALLGLSVVTIC